MFRASTSCTTISAGLDANPDHARQQAHHCVWSITRRLLETIQACLLDLADLIPDQPTTLHIATQLSHRVGRYWLVLGRAQIFKAPGGLLQLGIEGADAEPDQRSDSHPFYAPTYAKP